jgi:hypothetical protein
MQFLHIIIVPLLIFILSLFLQNWTDKNSFSAFYKIFFIGIIAGIIINLILAIFQPIFAGKPHHMTVFYKSLFIDGFLFTSIFIVSFYLVLDFFCDISISLDWPMTSILSIAYLGGIFTVINIIEAFSIRFPDSILYYFSMIPFLLLISMITGFGIPKYLDAYGINEKILWGLFTIGIPFICFIIYSYLRFYNYIEYYLFIIPFGCLAAVFEFREFKYFR